MCQSVGAAAVRALPASEATACPSAEPPEECGEGPSPAQVVSELIAAICGGRIEDVLALVDPQVVWRAVTRPALATIRGTRDGAHGCRSPRRLRAFPGGGGGHRLGR